MNLEKNKNDDVRTDYSESSETFPKDYSHVYQVMFDVEEQSPAIERPLFLDSISDSSGNTETLSNFPQPFTANNRIPSISGQLATQRRSNPFLEFEAKQKNFSPILLLFFSLGLLN